MSGSCILSSPIGFVSSHILNANCHKISSPTSPLCTSSSLLCLYCQPVSLEAKSCLIAPDSPRLVDFTKKNTVLNLLDGQVGLDGQVMFLAELHKYCNKNLKIGLNCFSSLSEEVKSAKTSISLPSMPD